MTTQEEVDAFLEHHGIKGMHWGVTKERTPERIQKDLDKIEKKRGSIPRRILPATAVIAGAGARAGVAQKKLHLVETKAPDGSKYLIPSDKTPKVTDENRKQFDKSIDRAAYRKYITTGVVVTGTLLATAYFGKTQISDPKLAELVTKGALTLAGGQTLLTANVTAGIHRNVVDRRNAEMKRSLKRELKIAQAK